MQIFMDFEIGNSVKKLSALKTIFGQKHVELLSKLLCLLKLNLTNDISAGYKHQPGLTVLVFCIIYSPD